MKTLRVDFVLCLGLFSENFQFKQHFKLLPKKEKILNSLELKNKEYFGHLENIGKSQLDIFISHYDLKRLVQYVENILDHHAIMDLTPTLAKIMFVYGFSQHVVLSQAQYCILLGIGLQYKQFEDVSKDLNIQVNQVMALYKKAIKKFVIAFKSIEEKAEEKLIPDASVVEMKPNPVELDDELIESSGTEIEKEKTRNLLNGLVNPDFIIQNNKSAWNDSTAKLQNKIPNIVSVKRKKIDSPPVTREEIAEKDKNPIPKGVTGKYKIKKKKTSNKDFKK